MIIYNPQIMSGSYILETHVESKFSVMGILYIYELYVYLFTFVPLQFTKSLSPSISVKPTVLILGPDNTENGCKWRSRLNVLFTH